MDPIAILAALVAIAAAILYFFRLRSSTPPRPDRLGSDTFTFTPEPTDAVPLVKRKVTIVAPPQTTAKGSARVKITAQPLPADPPAPPPAGKGIERLITTVINPSVTNADTGAALSDFDPPFSVTIEYTDADAEAGGAKDGRPRLSLVTFYQAQDGWRWERLTTEVDAERRQLKAQLRTLQPKDPFGIGAP